MEREETIRQIVDRVVERFHPERIIVFGSAARGRAEANSDIDLLVLMDVAGSKRRAAMEIDRALADREVPLDAIVMTPMEFEQQKSQLGTVARAAAEEGQVVHERILRSGSVGRAMGREG